MTSLAATEKPSGRFFSAAAMASRPPSSRAMPDRLTLVSDSVILPSFSLPIWSSSSSAALSKRGGAPRDRVRPVDHFDAAEIGAGRLHQPALARRQRRTARQRHPEDVAFGRPDKRLGFGNEPGFIVNQPHARHGFHRRHRTLPAVFRERIRRKRHVAARDRDSPFVEDGILEGGGRTLRQIGFQRLGAGPGRDSPKDDQRNDARPPFATPPEKSVHSSSRGVWNREKTNPCEAVKPEMTRRPKGSEYWSG